MSMVRKQYITGRLMELACIATKRELEDIEKREEQRLMKELEDLKKEDLI